MSASTTHQSNLLLAALPQQEHERVRANCEQVELVFAEVLAEPGERIYYVYFPTESAISLTTGIGQHSNLEVGQIGNEGMLGISLLLDVDIAPLRALVLVAGPALRMGTTPFRRVLEQNLALQQMLKRYLYVMMSQLAQTAACTHFHVVEARLARWLLMTGDRVHSCGFRVTHEFLAYLLGVRRAGITKAAITLQDRKLIHYNRGDLTILDHSGLEAASCGCYEANNATYAQIMGKTL
jgi:CRP-like cAMP-binding protein